MCTRGLTQRNRHIAPHQNVQWSRRRTALSSLQPACSNDLRLGAQGAGAPRVGAFRGRGVAVVACRRRPLVCGHQHGAAQFEGVPPTKTNL